MLKTEHSFYHYLTVLFYQQTLAIAFSSQNIMHYKSYIVALFEFKTLGEQITCHLQRSKFPSVRTPPLESKVTQLHYFELPIVQYL